VPTVSYPGVYVQETAGGTRPIAIASTSTTAFVGLAEQGPDDVAVRITSWAQFLRVFGTFIDDGYLSHSVFQYFNNGGSQCYVLRVTRSDAVAASVTLENRAQPGVDGFVFTARSKGAWGNRLYLQIEDGSLDPGNEFRVSVRMQDDPAVLPKDFRDVAPLEVWDNLSTDPAAPNYLVDVLKQQSAMLNARVLAGNTAVQAGVHRGAPGVHLPLGDKLRLQISLDGDGFQAVALPNATGTATAAADVAAAVQTAVRALTPLKTSTPAATFTGFTCGVETVAGQPRLVLTSGSSSATSSVQVQPGATADATGLLRLGPGNGGVSEGGTALRRPARVDIVQLGDAAINGPVTAVAAGTDGKADLSESSFQAAFPRLDTVTDVSLLAVPGESTPRMMDLGTGYCANRRLQDIFYIGEVSRLEDTAGRAAAFRQQLNSANSYGALYFPWIKTLDPTGRSREPIPLPPSGFVAGLYARIDATRGVWKAPAGTEAGIRDAVGLVVDISDVDHGNLNPIGVDVIRRFSGTGIVAFGARTVTADPEWTYVPVRRTAIMLRVSIYYAIQWAVFEPNDEPLWSQLRLTVGSFMTTLFRQGAFAGSTPSQAFFVKCDAETTTQADIDLGIVNVLVGFAPLKPAEFIVVKISQQAGQSGQ
jgi:phage tail sheath protein FI